MQQIMVCCQRLMRIYVKYRIMQVWGGFWFESTYTSVWFSLLFRMTAITLPFEHVVHCAICVMLGHNVDDII